MQKTTAKIKKYYAIWAEEGGFLETGYNSTSKKEVVTALKKHIGNSIIIADNPKPTTKEWLRFMRHNTHERYRIKSSETQFPWSIFED